MNRERNYDQEIDAALAMMDGTQSPADLGVRVQGALATAAASHAIRGARFFWISAAGAATAAVLLTVMVGMQEVRRQQRSVETGLTATHAEISEPPAVLPSRPDPVPVAVRRAHRRANGERFHPATLMNYPLTRQEKLLVQFVRTASPKDLEMLNPAYQAKLEDQQEAEFNAYLQSGSQSGSRDSETATTTASSAESSQPSTEE